MPFLFLDLVFTENLYQMEDGDSTDLLSQCTQLLLWDFITLAANRFSKVRVIPGSEIFQEISVIGLILFSAPLLMHGVLICTTCYICLQGSKLLGFQICGTPETGDLNPILGSRNCHADGPPMPKIATNLLENP